jgi:hypothetical protein
MGFMSRSSTVGNHHVLSDTEQEQRVVDTNRLLDGHLCGVSARL